MIETQLSLPAPITLNNNAGLGLTTKKEPLSNNSDTLTTCLQQQSYLPSEPVLPHTVSFTENPNTIIGMLIERISMLGTIISKLDRSVKKQLEDIVEKTNQVSSAFFESRKTLKTQEEKLKKWETVNLVATIPLAIASIWFCPTNLSEMRELKTLGLILLQVLSFGTYSQEKLGKRELLQLKAEDILLKDQMKRAEDQQESLHKKHKDSTSNLLEIMFLMGNNV